jgi:hypothetical protein
MLHSVTWLELEVHDFAVCHPVLSVGNAIVRHAIAPLLYARGLKKRGSLERAELR